MRVRSVLLAAMAASGVFASAAVAAQLDPMPIGAAARPPLGFLEFCERVPEQCDSSAALSPQGTQELRRWAARTRWAITFASLPVVGASGEPLPAPVQPTAALDVARPGGKGRSKTNSAKVADKHAKEKARRIAEHQRRWSPSSPAPASTAVFAGDAEQLTTLNQRINRSIRRADDASAHGQAEFWAIPEGRRAAGDCEDYVLAKRRALLNAGAPAQALSIAVVRTRRGEMHAVLLVATAGGEMVLDNLSPWVAPWSDAPYEWLERQVAGSTFHWAHAAVPGAG